MSRRSRARGAAAAAARRLRNWVQRLTREELVQAAELPLRRDMVTVLTYVRDHELKGTQSTGNFKLKDIRAMTADFVEPPELDSTIRGRTRELRSEDDVWPLYFLHVLAEIGGLLEGREARRWRLTRSGARFLTSPPPVQIWYMLKTWWEQVNWVLAFPYEGMGEGLPSGFRSVTRSRLLDLPVDERIPYESFADDLIEATGLTWTSEDESFHQMILRAAIHVMVIKILANFGVLEPEYKMEQEREDYSPRDLVAFRVTSFGHGLLEAI